MALKSYDDGRARAAAAAPAVHSWPLHSSTVHPHNAVHPPLLLLSAAAASASPVNCTRS